MALGYMFLEEKRAIDQPGPCDGNDCENPPEWSVPLRWDPRACFADSRDARMCSSCLSKTAAGADEQGRVAMKFATPEEHARAMGS